MSDVTQGRSDSDKAPRRGGLRTRRGFLKAAGVTTVLAAAAYWKFGVREDIDNPDFALQQEKKYIEAYDELKKAMPGAVHELVYNPVQFDLWDLGKQLKFEITLIPPIDTPHSRFPGALEYKILDDNKNRCGKFPAINRMLKACIDIAILDEKSGARKKGEALDYKEGEALDYNILATKIVHDLVNTIKDEKGKELPGFLSNLLKSQIPELANKVQDVVETAMPYLKQPPDNAPSREKYIKILTQEFHLTVLNPHLPENQKRAQEINRKYPNIGRGNAIE